MKTCYTRCFCHHFDYDKGRADEEPPPHLSPVPISAHPQGSPPNSARPSRARLATSCRRLSRCNGARFPAPKPPLPDHSPPLPLGLKISRRRIGGTACGCCSVGASCSAGWPPKLSACAAHERTTDAALAASCCTEGQRGKEIRAGRSHTGWVSACADRAELQNNYSILESACQLPALERYADELSYLADHLSARLLVATAPGGMGSGSNPNASKSTTVTVVCIGPSVGKKPTK